MRFTPLSEKHINNYIMAPISVLLLIVMFPVFLAIAVLVGVTLLLDKWLGPTEEWSAWFAWHWVHIDDQLVWLERIERRRVWSWPSYYTEYRLRKPVTE